MNMLFSAIFAALYCVLAVGVGRVHAVCPPGAIAIGRETVVFEDIIGTHAIYEGIAMNNNCGVLAKTNFAEDSSQVCSGQWDASVVVSCTNNVPTSAVTIGHSNLTCTPTTDTSCNVNTGGTDPVIFQVVACCSA